MNPDAHKHIYLPATKYRQDCILAADNRCGRYEFDGMCAQWSC